MAQLPPAPGMSLPPAPSRSLPSFGGGGGGGGGGFGGGAPLGSLGGGGGGMLKPVNQLKGLGTTHQTGLTASLLQVRGKNEKNSQDLSAGGAPCANNFTRDPRHERSTIARP